MLQPYLENKYKASLAQKKPHKSVLTQHCERLHTRRRHRHYFRAAGTLVSTANRGGDCRRSRTLRLQAGTRHTRGMGWLGLGVGGGGQRMRSVPRHPPKGLVHNIDDCPLLLLLPADDDGDSRASSLVQRCAAMAAGPSTPRRGNAAALVPTSAGCWRPLTSNLSGHALKFRQRRAPRTTSPRQGKPS